MTKNTLYILLLLCATFSSMAQNNAIFSGGNADGFNRDCYQQLIPTTIDFGGGSNDGHAKDCYQQFIPLTVDFGGGSNGGYAKDCFQQLIPLTVDFGGGANDGYAKSCFIQQSNLNAIFNGGNGGDGMLNGCANEPLGCFLAINLGNDTTFCSGNSLTLNAGTFPGGATYLWQDNSTNQTFTANVSGIYYVLVTDTGGCTGTDSIQITVNPVPNVNLGNDTSFCIGNNLVLNAQNSGATYQWQNGNTSPFLNQTFTASTTGQYFVKASFGFCTDSDTINLTVNPITTTNLTNTSICLGDSALIFGTYRKVTGTYRDTIMASTGCDSILVKQLIVNPVYNQTLATITICNGDSALIFGNYEKVAATYTTSLQSVNGCDSNVTQTLNVSPSHFVNLGNDTSFCAGNSITLNAGAGANSYRWQNGITTPFQLQTLTVNTTGTYYVVTTLGACTTSDTINITVNPNKTTSLPDSIICQGDSALIFGNYQTVAGNYFNTLTTSLGCDSVLVQRLIVNPIYNQTLAAVNICAGDSALILGNYETIAGVYSVNLQSVNGCDSIVSQTLGVLSNSSVNLGNDTTICAGENIVLNAGSATSYQWQNNSTNQTFNATVTGQYYVNVTTGGCSASDTINITVNPNKTTNLPNLIICQGDSVLIFGNYETIAGSYSNTLTTSLGCDSVVVQQLIVNPVYNQALATINICVGDSALIFGNYETVATTYVNNLQSINGCDSIISQTLNIDITPTVNLGNDTTFCSGNNLTLDAGSGATTYQWQNGNTNIFQNQTLTANTTGIYFVTATIGVCSATDSLELTVIQPVLTNYVDSVVCAGDSALIFGNYETIAGTYSDTLTSVLTGCDSILVQQLIVNPVYNQTLATVNICEGDSALIFGNYETIAATYVDTLQSINGCDSIVSQTLNIDATPIVNLGNDTTICSGSSLILDAGVGAINYQWQNGSTNPFLNQTFVANTTGIYFVTATIGVCSATDSVEVTVVQPVFTTNLVLNSCNGDSVLIFGNYENTSGLYYDTLQSTITSCDSIIVQELIINPNVIMNDTIVICIGESVFVGGALQSAAGTYFDTLQTALSCDSIIITELEVVTGFTVNIADTICEGESVFLEGALQTTSGIYYDSLQSLGGCDSLIITSLLVNSKPTIIVTAEPSFILAGQSSQLTATGGGSYTWTPGDNLSCDTCSSPIAKPIETTTYTVIVDSNGCFATDTITVTLDNEFMIPDGFSPNGDGVNDVFEIVGMSNYPDAQIIIFNRWGAKVFEANPYKGDWNGTNQFGLSIGDKLPAGTYFYILDLGKESPQGEQEIKGYIYLNN